MLHYPETFQKKTFQKLPAVWRQQCYAAIALTMRDYSKWQKIVDYRIPRYVLIVAHKPEQSWMRTHYIN